MFDSQFGEALVEDEFLIDIYSKHSSVFIAVEWEHNEEKPRSIALKFTPDEVRHLILNLEQQLTTHEAV